MSDFFLNRMDYIFFFYGLGFLVMAQVCLGMRRPAGEPRWFWLGLFGVTHGLNEWLDLVANNFGDSFEFNIARNVVLIISFIFLFEFARSSRREIRGRTPGAWIYLPLLGLIALSALEGLKGVNAVSRYTLGLGGGLWSAYILLTASRNPDRKGSGWLVPVGLAIGLYGLATGIVVPEISFPPGSVLNYRSFIDFAGFPVQLARGVLAIVAACAILIYAHPRYRKHGFLAYYPSPYMTFFPIAIILSMLVGGWFVTEELGTHDVEDVSDTLKSNTVLAARLMDPADVSLLLKAPDEDILARVEGVMRMVVESDPNAISACVVSAIDVGPRVVARVAKKDAEQGSACTYIGRVDVRSESPKVEGPFRIQDIDWMVSGAPIVDPGTGKPLARLVVGFDGKPMRKLILLDRFFSILVTGTLCVLFVMLITIWQRNRESNAQKMELGLARQKLADEKRLREITSALGEGVMVIDTEGRITFMNPEAERMLGWREQELLGKDIHEMIQHRHAESEPAGRGECPSCRVVKTGEAFRSDDEVFTRKDGSVFQVSYVAAPIVIETRIAGAVIAFQDITDRKSAEKVVKESERSYRTLSSNLPGIVYRVHLNEENRMQFFNEMVLPMTGYSPGELSGGGICSFESLIHEDDVNDVLNSISISMMEETPFLIEYRLRRKDGDIRHFLERGRPVRGEDGEYRYIDGVIFDVTDRKRMEERFARVNECFVSFSPDPTVNIGRLTALCGEMMGASTAGYSRMDMGSLVRVAGWNMPEYGRESEPGEGKVCYDIARRGTEDMVYIEDLHATAYVKSEPELIRQGFVSYIGHPVRSRGGTLGMLCLMYRSTYAPDDGDRRLVALIASAIAVEEERRISDEELKKFRFIVEGAGEEIFLLGTDGRVLYANEAACDALGYGRTEVADLVVADFMSDSEAREFPVHVEELKRRDLPAFETEYRTKYGKVAPKEVKSAYLEIGGEAYVCSFSRDISERRDLERKKDEFFGMVTHDLKSPLSIILGYSDLMMSEFSDALPDKTVDMARSINTNSRRLLSMVEDFLAISSLESRGIEFTMNMVSPSTIAVMASEEVRPLTEKTGTGFQLDMEEGLPSAAMNGQYMFRALMNLLYNAFAYTPAGGAIKLRVYSERRKGVNQLVFGVTDNGPGIPEPEAAKVFERYYRMSGNSDIPGTGMGLAIVKAVAEAHGGKAELDSEPGRGSTFRIVIPFRRI